MAKNNFFEEPQESSEQKIVLPKHNNWIWPIVIVLIVLLAALGFWYTQNNKQGVAKPTVSDFASCKAAGGQIMESFPEQCKLGDQTFSNPNQVAPKPVETQKPPQNLKTYTDATNKFSFAYPDTLVQSEGDINSPYTATPVAITSQIFAHTIPIEHCTLKPECTPTTTDFSIGFTIVNSSVAKIVASPKMAGTADITLGASKLKYLEMGVEGEGIIYYFIALPSGKTLMISQTFLSDSILSEDLQNLYKTKGFITRTEQDALAKQILTSLSFETSTSTSN